MTGESSHGRRVSGFAVPGKRLAQRLLCSFVLFGVTLPVFSGELAAAEGQLRAAVTVGVLRFTSWQDVDAPHASAADGGQMQICLQGKPFSGPYLLPVSGQARVGQQTLEVLNQPKTDDWPLCEAFVLGPGVSSAQTTALFRFAADSGVLTICDGCTGAAADGAMIKLNLDNQRVKFEVNLKPAEAAQVHLDASLLELASAVRK